MTHVTGLASTDASTSFEQGTPLLLNVWWSFSSMSVISLFSIDLSTQSFLRTSHEIEAFADVNLLPGIRLHSDGRVVVQRLRVGRRFERNLPILLQDIEEEREERTDRADGMQHNGLRFVRGRFEPLHELIVGDEYGGLGAGALLQTHQFRVEDLLLDGFDQREGLA